MSESITFNEDCLDGMRRYPDGFFSLAVVDPPYGGGCSQSLHVERERERESRTDDRRITDSGVREADSSGTSVTRTGGTWAEKYGKKS